MSFLKNFWKTSAKHKKLSEEWVTVLTDGRECIQDASERDESLDEKQKIFMNDSEVSFHLKYLGSTLVETPSSEEATAEAIKTIITMSKASGKKLQRISLSTSLRGIRITDLSKNEDIHQISLYRISYCSADATHDHVFAFIATNFNETLECHAFLCPKRKVAQTVALTVAQAFNTAYEAWRRSQGINRVQDKKITAKENETSSKQNNEEITQNRTNSENDKHLLIDFSCDIKTNKSTKTENWVGENQIHFGKVYFEDDEFGDLNKAKYVKNDQIFTSASWKKIAPA